MLSSNLPCSRCGGARECQHRWCLACIRAYRRIRAGSTRLCGCGCGESIQRVVTSTDGTRTGYVAFIPGHSQRTLANVKSQRLSGQAHPSWKGTELDHMCRCGRAFRGRGTYCSRTCYWVAVRSSDPSVKRGKRPRTIKLERQLTCGECGITKAKSMFPTDARGRAFPYYCLSCLPVRDERRRKYANASTSMWQKKNPGMVRARQQRRLVRMTSGDLTPAQWDGIVRAFGGRCAYCGTVPRRIEQDHILPLSRGGVHSAYNVVPACRSCNAHKAGRTVEEWREADSVKFLKINAV